MVSKLISGKLKFDKMFKKYNSIDRKVIKEYNKIRNISKCDKFCHAPFKTLFFSEYGEILACFYNKSVVLGKYPENTISEIWNGEALNKLRNHIRHKDLNYGCEDCKRYLTQKNYYSVGAWKYDYLPNSNSKYPVSLDFQISNICNLECIMCNGEYSTTVRQLHEKKQAFPNPYDKNFIEQLTPFMPYLKEAAFTGGEVFLIKLYYDIWDKLIEINPSVLVSITTNGTILNQKIINILSKLRFNITISIDSIDKDIYESIRKNANIDKILLNMDYFHEYTINNNTSLNVKICPMRQNWHTLPELFQYLNNKNIPIIFNNVVFPPYCSLWNLDSPKLSEIFNYLLKFSFLNKNAIQKDNISRWKNFLSQIENWNIEATNREKKYPDLNSATPEQLLDMLCEKINFYIQESALYFNDNEQKKAIKFREIMQSAIDEINNSDIIKNAFIYYIGLPVHRLMSEINIRNIEKIIDRTKQAGKVI